MDNGRVIHIGGAWFLADWGPLRIKIGVWKEKRPLIDLARKGAYYALYAFREVCEFLPILKVKANMIRKTSFLPQTVNTMIKAARLIGEPDMTPLCAVAGAIGERTVSYLSLEGADKVIAENGGDIAIYMKETESTVVGIRPKVDERSVRFIVKVEGSMGIGGIATSGLGGRSLTKGVADAVVIFGKTASISDAAATAVANSTYVCSSRVKRVLAEKLDENTDLKGEEVTAYVDTLTPMECNLALERGLKKAEELRRRGLILEAVLFIQGHMGATQGIKDFIEEVRE